MKRVKNIMLFFFLFSLIVSSFVTPDALAQTADSSVNVKAVNDVAMEIQSDPSLYNPNNPNEVKAQLEKVYFDDTPSNSGDIKFMEQGGVVFSIILVPIEGSGNVRLASKIVSFIGGKPHRIDFDLHLYRGATRGTGTYVKTCSSSLSGILGVQVGKEITCDLTIDSTGYYFLESKHTIKNMLGMTLGASSGQTSQYLLNTKASLYPNVSDPYSGKAMTEPRADWAYTGSIPWTKTDRGNFIAEYSRRHPNNGWNWSGEFTEIHHIRPRQYGGSNDYDNLIPLEKWFHQGPVEGWWRYYR
ncbi:HNH endonuclease [Paenibacillus sp. MZ04-78.2]|uniref:HNH endonuclease signature motif containing protein n=1 Tax=Paenibacillus sp. MZ04-78.2 TaxID=2962034 RepID=UPI0020B8BF0C|nr:HNH endonuclease signature motif containing protein [Paenibacillus sp. MZ04-78.2]MCP3773526.1 HNH endonuclease [Paenibacillus sp. MZ04-78.2]